MPARIRPDLWTAHCRVGPFPTPAQGLNALKKLREFRKLHELCWNKTNPGWSKEPKKNLIRLIMDQRENSAADLAKVLSIQRETGIEMAKKRSERKKEQKDWLDKRWKKLDAMAKSVRDGKIRELERKLRDCKSERGNKLDNNMEVRRLETAMSQIRREIRELLWAQRIVEQHNTAQSKLKRAFKRDTMKMEELKAKLKADGKTDKAERLRLPQMGANPVRESLLPKSLASIPRPFSLQGIECYWADLHDPECAGQTWPASVVHSSMPTRKVLTLEEYKDQIAEEKQAVQDQTKGILEELVFNAENERRVADGLPPLPRYEVEKPLPTKGIAKYMPRWMLKFKSPFDRQAVVKRRLLG